MCFLEMRLWELSSALLSISNTESASTMHDNLLLTRMSWTTAFSPFRDLSYVHSEGMVQYAFEGTLPEWAAVFGAVTDLPSCGELFAFLLENWSASFVRQTPGILLSVLLAHASRWSPCSVNCQPSVCDVAKTIACGASLEPPEYQVTPLQIAAARGDVNATRMLLAAGAKVNSTGPVGGTAFSTRNPLSHINSLHGASPLYLCRRYLQHCASEYVEGGLHVERLLLEHGGEELRTSMHGLVEGCEIVDDIVDVILNRRDVI
ncbi:hypothetical protein QBC33DRAFT_177849 [Phialemonium atrogriseum]|uniref:Uncharacterized protein n=1 Tax=Phialemonium atrogriseum TaxID=1093897 RepID=A0AAJ0BWZ2_9PEZI|nr:uncharacterized protein QBC33DRAFT_177849 [Phialemonium atrogriseum]KAK1764943.1 hypothetical protein QBC33DRAFT_177849 [Phialemonium atrogriseum]